MARVKDVFSGVPHCTSKNVSSFPLPAPESTHPHTYRPTDPKEGSGPKPSLSLPPHPVGEPALVTLRSPVPPLGPVARHGQPTHAFPRTTPTGQRSRQPVHMGPLRSSLGWAGLARAGGRGMGKSLLNGSSIIRPRARLDRTLAPPREPADHMARASGKRGAAAYGACAYTVRRCITTSRRGARLCPRKPKRVTPFCSSVIPPALAVVYQGAK